MEEYSKKIEPQKIDTDKHDLFKGKKVDKEMGTSSTIFSHENKEVEDDDYKKITPQDLYDLETEDPVLFHAITKELQNSVEEEIRQNEIEDRDKEANGFKITENFINKEEQIQSLRESIDKAIKEKEQEESLDKEENKDTIDVVNVIKELNIKYPYAKINPAIVKYNGNGFYSISNGPNLDYEKLEEYVESVDRIYNPNTDELKDR